MGTLIGHIVKGKWTFCFKTKSGAIRVAKRKYPTKEIGEPFRWGNCWNVYVHKKRKVK